MNIFNRTNKNHELLQSFIIYSLTNGNGTFSFGPNTSEEIPVSYKLKDKWLCFAHLPTQMYIDIFSYINKQKIIKDRPQKTFKFKLRTTSRKLTKSEKELVPKEHHKSVESPIDMTNLKSEYVLGYSLENNGYHIFTILN